MTTFEQRLRDTLSHTYDIQRELGGGGMSRVFVAIDRSLGRKVVIKLLSPELIADVNRGRFRREIQVAAQLQHPHIVPLLSAGEHEDLVYYTMPFISGESLKSAVEKGPLAIADAVRVIYHVGEALDYAHGEGVVHRDIKPANILRSGSYSLVTDFGVAKALNASMPSAAGMTSTGMAIGTPAYMAPEQLAGDATANHRIDIYALGLLAYELLYGKSPFAAATAQRVLAAVLTHDPAPLIDVRDDVPRRLSDLVMSCLSKEPDQRPQSARAVLRELDVFSNASGEIRTMEHMVPALQRSTPTTAPPVTVPPEPLTSREKSPPAEVPAIQPEPPKKKRSPLLVGGLALLLPVVAGAIYLSQQRGDASQVPAILPTDSALAPIIDSLPTQSAVPAPIAESTAVVPTANAKKLADSVRRAARLEAAKKAAARDSVLRAQELAASSSPSQNARRAAAAMLADPAALRAFNRGATRKGGPLNTRRLGDLQTQIDALQPFLATAGLSYAEFKDIVQGSGVVVYDEFGRMVPDSLLRFSRNSN